MKLASSQIEKRIAVTLDKSIRSEGDNVTGIMKFGANNDYPQTIERLINGSKTAKAVVNIYSRFLIGKGFESPINDIVVGMDARGKEMTISKLLRQVSLSVAYNRGVYIHTALNLDRKVVEVKLIPFKYCRFSKVDDNGYSPKIGVYSNWDKDPDQKYNKRNIVFYNTFNLKPTVFAAQIAALPGESVEEKINGFKGQVYFQFFDEQYLYPLSPFDSVYMDLDTEQQVSLFKNNMTRNGMLKKTVLRVAEPTNEKDAEDLVKEIEKWQGTGGASTITLYDEVDPKTGEIKANGAFKVDTIDSNIDDALFTSWEKSLTNDIRKPFNIPAILIDYEESKLGTTSGEAIIQATNFFNSMTRDDRKLISEIFKEIFSNSVDEKLSTNQNWNIKEIELYGTPTTV